MSTSIASTDAEQHQRTCRKVTAIAAANADQNTDLVHHNKVTLA